MNSLEEMALEEGVETLLSDLGGLTPQEIMASLREGDLPEGVSVWLPFEDYSPQILAHLIEGFASQFARFATRATEGK